MALTTRTDLGLSYGAGMTKIKGGSMGNPGVIMFGASICFLGGCATHFDLVVPSSEVDRFEQCLADPAISWQLVPATASHAATPFTSPIAEAKNTSIVHRRPLTATAPKLFRNMYAESIAKSPPMSVAAKSANAAAAASVDRVAALLQHSVQGNIYDIYNGLSGTSPTTKTSFKVSEVGDYVSRVAQSVSLDDWTPYANSAIYSFAMASRAGPANSANLQDVQDLFDLMAMAIYIETYFKAYFRNGEFVTGAVSLQTLETTVPALKDLKDPFKTQLKNILDSLSKDLTFGKIADAGFVTRGGSTLQMPAVNISFDVARAQISASKIDYLAIGSDLIRVFLEAVFDSQDRLPAVTDATGVSLASTHTGTEAIQLPDFQKIQPRSPYKQISQKQFGSIDTFANEVDAASGTATGQLLRGAGLIALNNEAIAKLIEAAIGASVHKVGEKLGWCWYATGPLPITGMAEAPNTTALPDNIKAAFAPAQGNAAPVGEIRRITVTVYR